MLRKPAVLTCLALLAGSALPASAQLERRPIPPDSILAMLHSGSLEAAEGGARLVERAFSADCADYTRQERAQLLAGLRDFAMSDGAGPGVDVQWAQTQVVATLQIIALRGTCPGSEKAPAVLIQLARESASPAVRAGSVGALGEGVSAYPQVASQVAELLYDIAASPPGASVVSPAAAVAALERAGAVGRGVLWRLHRGGVVRSETARMRLDELVRRGYIGPEDGGG